MEGRMPRRAHRRSKYLDQEYVIPCRATGQTRLVGARTKSRPSGGEIRGSALTAGTGGLWSHPARSAHPKVRTPTEEARALPPGTKLTGSLSLARGDHFEIFGFHAGAAFRCGVVLEPEPRQIPLQRGASFHVE